MSELKATTVYDAYWKANSVGEGTGVLVYLKSEADKVFAEKDAEIERLEILCATYRHDCDNLAISNEQAKRAARTLLKKMNYNKYKRCLAMARWCESKVYHIRRTPLCDMDEHEGWQHDDEFWQRWHKRWLELAENFKEAK